jgi:hypothetical protein
MKIIISPAKKMEKSTDILDCTASPYFLKEAETLVKWLQERSLDELKSIWKCNDKIAHQNYERLQDFFMPQLMSPAVFTYVGLQYQHMAPHVMDTDSLKWLEKNLRILSGVYGVLRPLDCIIPYRLEMQSRLEGFETPSLYKYWGSKIYDFLTEEEKDFILNLASKEYSKCITDYTKSDKSIPVITCVFGEICSGKVKEKGTFAKMARGDMVRYLASIGAKSLEDVKSYTGLGYCFSEDFSNENTFVFIKK